MVGISPRPEYNIGSADGIFAGVDDSRRWNNRTGAGMDTQAEAGGSMNDGSAPLRTICDEAYVMTLVLVTRKGAIVTKAIDSRFDDVEKAWEEMKISEKPKEIVYRLVLAEDLPKATERQLEKLLQSDCRMLIDHAANKRHAEPPSLREQASKAEFHLNISEPSAATSVAIPYVIHGATELPVHGQPGRVDLRLANKNFETLYWPLFYQGEREQTLRTIWLGLPPCGYNIQRYLYVAYRRISLQFITTPRQEPPICLILMYPQLRFVDRGNFVYSLSRDLMHPPTPDQGRTQIDRSAADGMRIGNMPDVSATLVHYLATQLGVGDQTTTTVRTTISRWMVINTQATFRGSIRSTVDYWCALSRMIQHQNGPGQKIIVEGEDCLGRFIEVIATQISQIRKAKAEITERESAEVMDADPMERNHLDPMNLDGLEWCRMMNCLESILSSTRRELHRREQGVQVAMTNMQLRESQTAIKQAETVKRLTQLAFIFIPISVTCSAFGMNIQELANSPPSVWVSLLVMLGVTLTTIICSLESTHKVLWSIRKFSRTPVPKKSSSPKPPDWWYNEIVDEDSAREGWPWPKFLPWLIRQFKRLIRVLYYACRAPLAVVQRVIGVGAQHRKHRREIPRHGHESEEEP